MGDEVLLRRFQCRLVLSQPHLMHATPVFVSLPCPGAQTLRIQIDQRVKAAQFVTELGSNSQLHAIKLDEHAVAQLFVKPIEGYHQVKRCSLNEFISGSAVALGETAHRVPVSGQAVVVKSRQQRLGMLGIIHSHPTLTKQFDLFTVGLELLHLLHAHPCLIRKTKTGPGLPPRRAVEPVMLTTRLPD